MFFDQHPEFLETSHTAASRDRLNMRHLALIEANADILRGHTVVDIASHDGRWSFGALEAGAAKVIGLEGRRSLVRHARRTFRAKGVPSERFRFVQGDAHQLLFRPGIKGEVVMCLGFLYHTARYVELMAGIESTGAEYVIVDSRVIQTEAPYVEFRTERTDVQSVAIKDDYALSDRVISAVPSEAALLVMLEAAGYELMRRTDWPALLHEHPGKHSIAQYATGTRVSFVVRKRG